MNSLFIAQDFSQETRGQIPVFSLSAQGYVKLIVEHLLVLRQLLDPYDANEAMNLKSPEKFGETSKTDDIDELEDYPEKLHVTEGFARMWITAVVEATMNLYVEKIFEIPTLTEHGALQLSVDIAHVFNCLGALGINPNPTLNQIHILVSAQNRESFMREIEKLGPNASVVSNIIGKKRGWNIVSGASSSNF